jgi:hypothetical protein
VFQLKVRTFQQKVEIKQFFCLAYEDASVKGRVKTTDFRLFLAKKHEKWGMPL